MDLGTTCVYIHAITDSDDHRNHNNYKRKTTNDRCIAVTKKQTQCLLTSQIDHKKCSIHLEDEYVGTIYDTPHIKDKRKHKSLCIIL